MEARRPPYHVLHINNNVMILKNVQEMLEGNIIKLVTTLLCLSTLLLHMIEVMNFNHASFFKVINHPLWVINHVIVGTLWAFQHQSKNDLYHFPNPSASYLDLTKMWCRVWWCTYYFWQQMIMDHFAYVYW